MIEAAAMASVERGIVTYRFEPPHLQVQTAAGRYGAEIKLGVCQMEISAATLGEIRFSQSIRPWHQDLCGPSLPGLSSRCSRLPSMAVSAGCTDAPQVRRSAIWSSCCAPVWVTRRQHGVSSVSPARGSARAAGYPPCDSTIWARAILRAGRRGCLAVWQDCVQGAAD